MDRQIRVIFKAMKSLPFHTSFWFRSLDQRFIKSAEMHSYVTRTAWMVESVYATLIMAGILEQNFLRLL